MSLKAYVRVHFMISSAYTNTRLIFAKLKGKNGLNVQSTFHVANEFSFSVNRNFGNVAPDNHKVLGVPLTATKKEIKAAYLELAKKHHPDTNLDDSNAKIRFQEISDAYEALVNDKRSQSHSTSNTSTQWESESFTKAQMRYQERYGSPWHKSSNWKSKKEFENLTLPPNVKIRDVFKQIIIDFGFEDAVKSWDKLIADAKISIQAAWRGERKQVYRFAQDHKIFTICFVSLLSLLVCFPWIIDATIVILWYIYYFILCAIGFLCLFCHSPTFIIFVIKPLHTRFMMKAQKAAKRKQGS